VLVLVLYVYICIKKPTRTHYILDQYYRYHIRIYSRALSSTSEKAASERGNLELLVVATFRNVDF
jgi:hypothetical protein